MKKMACVMALFTCLIGFTLLAACTETSGVVTTSDGATNPKPSELSMEPSGQPVVSEMKLLTRGNTFIVKLRENAAAQALMKQLPMTVEMGDLNGNEKYYYLSDSLPTEAESPTQIHAGDVMLYGSDCLVVFYKSFTTSYSYTPIGRIENTDGLGKALGGESITVSLS